MTKHVDEFQTAIGLSATHCVAIQVCNKDGRALATYVDGLEVEALADGPSMGVREPYEVSPFPSFDPVPRAIKAGSWDEDFRKFTPFPSAPLFRDLEELRIWLEAR